MKTHHWRWRSPKYLLLCGAKNGLINQRDPSDITCKTCIKMMEAREKQFPNMGWDRRKDGKKESQAKTEA